jgi:hypothetical protein
MIDRKAVFTLADPERIRDGSAGVSYHYRVKSSIGARIQPPGGGWAQVRIRMKALPRSLCRHL